MKYQSFCPSHSLRCQKYKDLSSSYWCLKKNKYLDIYKTVAPQEILVDGPCSYSFILTKTKTAKSLRT